MANREAMRALIEQAYAARAKGDIDVIMSAFHAHSRFEFKGDKRTLDMAGLTEGADNIRKLMAGLTAAFQFTDREILSVIIEGDDACVHSRLRIIYTPKNESFTTDIVDLFKFKDGKITELVEFADTALIKQITAEAVA